MQPAPVDRCRVLEIGCGPGVNILPMAERHPDSTFVGVDRRPNALAAARHFAAQAALPNVAFHDWKPGQTCNELGAFDYVICHDVYSRLALAEQDALLELCRARLGPQGVLYLSYRAQPGWIVPGVVRDLAQRLSAGADSASQSMQQSRRALEFLSQSQSADTSPWGRMLKREAALAMSLPEATFAHEYSSGESHPRLFVELASRAAAHRLQYLGDADIPSTFAAAFEPAVQQKLAQAARDTVSLEQYMDLLRNRSVHHSLFCHQAVRRAFQWTPERLGGLFLAGNVCAANPPIDYAADEPARFVAADGRTFGVALPAAKAALEAIGAAWPRAVAFDALLHDVTAKLSGGAVQVVGLDDAERDELARNLIECIVNDLVEVHSDTDRFTTEISARPQVGTWTRAEAAASERVTNRRHQPVLLDEMSRNLLQFLDGTRDRAALLAVLVAAAERGQLSILRGDLPARSSEAAAILEQVLDQALRRLANGALLVG
jgi:methyltransferase-like protein